MYHRPVWKEILEMVTTLNLNYITHCNVNLASTYLDRFILYLKAIVKESGLVQIDIHLPDLT